MSQRKKRRREKKNESLVAAETSKVKNVATPDGTWTGSVVEEWKKTTRRSKREKKEIVERKFYRQTRKMWLWTNIGSTHSRHPHRTATIRRKCR